MKNRSYFAFSAVSAALAAVALIALPLLTTAASAGEPRTVEITVTDRGYEPSRVELVEDEPVRLVFHQQAKSACAHSVKSEELGIETTDLPAGETTVVELTPAESGEFTFACGMGMLKGTLIVESR